MYKCAALILALLLWGIPGSAQAVGNGGYYGPVPARTAIPLVPYFVAQSVGNGNSPPLLIGYHVELFTVTNASLTCTLGALCSVGNVTFNTAYPNTSFRCAAVSVAATAGVSVTPTISAKATGGITVNAFAIIGLVAQSVTVEGMCLG